MSKRSPDGLYKRGAIWWGWRRKQPGAPLTRASTECRDRQAARLVKAEWERMAADPARYAASQTTFGEALAMYMETQRQAGLSPHTVKAYDLHCRQLARTLDQDTLLKDIGHQSFKGHIKAREAEGTHPHTISRELVRLMGVLVDAKRRGRYPHDLTGMRPRYAKQYKPRERALTIEEIVKLAGELRADRLAHVAFVIATGARRKEAFLARAEDIADGYVYLRGTKTEGARRTVPVAPPFRQLLEFAIQNAPGAKGDDNASGTPGDAQRSIGGNEDQACDTGSRHVAQPNPHGENAVGPVGQHGRARFALPEWRAVLGADASAGDIRGRAESRKGAGPGPKAPAEVTLFSSWSQARRDILAACKRAGIAPCTWNDLRRTNATLLSEAGVGGELGHKLMGHSDDRMWNQVYAKPRPVALARQLEAIFQQAPVAPIEVQPRMLPAKGAEDEDGGGVVADVREQPRDQSGSGTGRGDPGGRPGDGCPSLRSAGGRSRHVGSSAMHSDAVASGPGEDSEPETNSTEMTRFGTVALTLCGFLPASNATEQGLRSRRSTVRAGPGVPVVSSDNVDLAQSASSTHHAESAGSQYIHDTGACVWCDGSGYVPQTGIMCRPCHGTGSTPAELRVLPAIGLTREEVEADLAPRGRL